MLKELQLMHKSYLQAIKENRNVGTKKLVATWWSPNREITSGQFFEKKILPNGNIKTRILTIGSERNSTIGLETKVVNPTGGLVYKSIGIIKKSKNHIQRKIKELNLKMQNKTITGFERKLLETLELSKKQNTKSYKTGPQLGIVRDLLYRDKQGAKTLIGETYGTY